MSSFYDDASLVVIPSGYKTSKVYAEKPTDGSGDLAFTRTGDTATRVNSAGLIEKVRTNLNPNGNLVGLALNTSPTGYTNFNTGTFEPVTNTTSEVGTFCKFTTSGTRSFLVRSFTGITSGINYSFSFKVQSVTGSLALDNSFLVTSGGTGSIYYVDGVPTASGTAITQGTVYVEFEATASTVEIRIGSGVAVAATAVLEIGNFQLESGDIATSYIATTSAAVTVGPVANVPRLDYLGSTCPRLLLEPQRTNLATFSESFDNADWTKEGITITANATTSPDGYTNADKLVASASAGDKITYQVATVSNGVAYTASAYYKASEYTYAFMRLGGITGNPYVIYNLSTQALVGSASLTSSSITSVGNGWYRITATATTTTTVLAPNVMLIPSTGYTLGGDNVPEFTGNGASGGFVWGAQLEAGAYATSYIPTLGAAVTRGADACSKTGISSLIGQTEGTLFMEVGTIQAVSDNLQMFGIDDTTSSNRIEIGINGNNQFYIYAQQGGNTIFEADLVTFANNAKIAVAYKANSWAVYVNGVKEYENTSANWVPTCSAYRLIGRYDGAGVNKNTVAQALVFKTRLTNAQLAELTTI